MSYIHGTAPEEQARLALLNRLTNPPFIDFLAPLDNHRILEVGSGSGGPAAYLAVARHCKVTGVDINEHGVRNARELAFCGTTDPLSRWRYCKCCVFPAVTDLHR